MKPEKLILKKCFDEKGKYLGCHAVYIKTLTPEFLDLIKADKDDKMDWKQHRKVMKEHGYNIG